MEFKLPQHLADMINERVEEFKKDEKITAEMKKRFEVNGWSYDDILEHLTKAAIVTLYLPVDERP